MNFKRDKNGMLILASDHIGFNLKQEIKEFVSSLGYGCEDYGCFSEERVHYPIYAYRVAREVAKNNFKKGILFCGTGVGMAIAANKVSGIRAVNCIDSYTAQMSREHNNTNILTLGSKVLSSGLAKIIVKAWLESEYEGGRHDERLEMISSIENNEFSG